MTLTNDPVATAIGGYTLEGAATKMLADEHVTVFRQLLQVLNDKRARHQLRADYYDSKNALRDMGISIPPSLESFATVLGWPARSVDAIADRAALEGFATPGSGDQDPYGIRAILDDNELLVEAPQAFASSLIHATAFLAITQGDTSSGEPEVLISARSGVNTAAIWDPRRRRIAAALSIITADQDQSSGDLQPLQAILYLPDSVITLTRDKPGQAYSADVRKHSLGRVPVEPLPFRPRLGRPFGSSRITRGTMALTDAALRTILRSEVAAEFYSSPQRYILGADPEAFDGGTASQWQSIMGRLWALDHDEEAAFPTSVGQFPQVSMQPHGEQLRMFASLFAGETSLPLDELGIISDNPSSAEALHASERRLVLVTNGAVRGWSPRLERAMRTAVELREGKAVPELAGLQALWGNTALPSEAAATDSAVKLVGAFPDLASSPVMLARAGFDAPTIERLEGDRRRFAARQLAADALAARAARVPAPAGTPAAPPAEGVPVG